MIYSMLASFFSKEEKKRVILKYVPFQNNFCIVAFIN